MKQFKYVNVLSQHQQKQQKNSLISAQIKVSANLHRHNWNNKLNENNKLANYLNDNLILHLVIDTFFCYTNKM